VLRFQTHGVSGDLDGDFIHENLPCVITWAGYGIPCGEP